MNEEDSALSEQTIPAEVFSKIPHTENVVGVQYHVINGSPGSSHGETHLVATEGTWYVFHRRARTDSLIMATLKDSEMPRVKSDPFGVSLLLRFDNQPEEVQIPLNPGEMDAVENCINHSWPKEAVLLEVVGMAEGTDNQVSQGALNKALNLVKKAGREPGKLHLIP